jgi:hypothetical protein
LALSWADFYTCATTYSTYVTCTLDAGSYTVSSTVVVQGFNKTISGYGSDWSNTVVTRASGTYFGPIFQLAPNTSFVHFVYLTIDGNRSNVTAPSGNNAVDIDLNPGNNTSDSSVANCYFQNAPDYSVLCSTNDCGIAYNYFTNAHETGLYLYQSGFTLTNAGIYGNTFYKNGGGGVAMYGTNVDLAYNVFDSNGGEFPDATSDGQLVILSDSNYVTLETNMFDGGYVGWGGANRVRGIEGYGENDTLQANTFQNHSGQGIYYVGTLVSKLARNVFRAH